MRPSAGSRGFTTLAALVLVLATAGCGLADEVTLPTAPPTASEGSEAPEEPNPEEPTSEEPTQEEPAPEEPTQEEPAPEEPTSEDPSASDPAIALPPASDSPGEEEPDPTSDPTTEEPTTPPATESSPEETSSAPPSETATEEPSPTDPETSEEPESEEPEDVEDENSGLPTWIPLVAAVAVIAGAAILLFGRSRRKRWDEAFGIEQTQAQWVLDELLPATTDPATPLGTRAANWNTSQQTLDMLQAGLTGLLPDAPDDARTRAAQGLSAAVTEVRHAVAADLALQAGTAPPPPPSPTADGEGAPPSPTDATVAATPPTTPGPAQPSAPDPAALASSAARVAVARDRLSTALASARAALA